MTDPLFGLAFWLAAPVWALLILAPGRRLTDRVAASALPLVPLLVVYGVLAAQVLPELWTVFRNPDLAGFQELMARPAAASALWAQVIAWDLFLGQWIYREARAHHVHPVLMAPVLLLAILFSPFGVALFLLIRTAARAGRWGRRAEPGDAPAGAAPAGTAPAGVDAAPSRPGPEKPEVAPDSRH